MNSKFPPTPLFDLPTHSSLNNNKKVLRKSDSPLAPTRRWRTCRRHAVLVLPEWVDVLPGGREHLLRGHADGDQPGARDPAGGPLRGGEPGDTAPALIALEASMVIKSGRGAGGAGGGVFRGPDDQHHADDGAAAGELLTAIPDSGDVGGGAVLLREGAGPAGVGLPAGERGVGDQGDRGHDQAARIAVGAVAARPLRLTAVEQAVAGSRAAKRRRRGPASWRSRRAPLRYNGYKIPLMRNLVKRAIRGQGTARTT
jgi:hypothetical protein